MLDFLGNLFNTDGFVPRWDCGRWSAPHGWLHVLSDLGVWSAYLAIPLVLGFFIIRRKDLPFRGVFVLFGLFILACGTTHLMEAIIFWWPAYRLAGLIKLATAVVSWATVCALIPITPKVLGMRSPEELSREIAKRQDAETALRRANADLESRVRERTAQLRDADRRKDEFLATLAHELRNPLAPVRNALHILQKTDGNGEHAKIARQTMERQVHHMVRLVDDLLDVSRITRGKLELRKTRVNLADVVHAALETSRPLVESFDHRIHVALPHTPIWLDADQVRLAQVLSNLINNAAKFTDRGGDIWLSALATEKEAVVKVRDSGAGIPPELIDRVFDLFAQADVTRDRSQGGLGIGLMLVKQLVELHGGTVSATSEGAGKGSEFVVRLPIAAPPTPIVTSAAPKSAPARALKILVVDDNRDSADSLAEVLRISGHCVSIAYDGPTALKIAEGESPEAIVLDLGLPHMSGYEVATILRGQPWGKGCRLVALTGWGQDADIQRTREIGFDVHLVKPVEIERLFQALSADTPTRRVSEGMPR